MSSSSQDQKFGSKFLDDIVDWISDAMEPGDVFSESRLEGWAEANGYVKESRA